MVCSLCGKEGHNRNNQKYHTSEKEYVSRKSPSKKRHYKDPVRHAKFERCVLKLKHQKGITNPYAVCNASIPQSSK